MKKLNFQYVKLIVILGIFFSATSCNDYLDINTDPTNPQEVNAEILIAPIFQEMVRGEVFDSRLIGQYIQNWHFVTANNVWDAHGYASGSDLGGEKWRAHYYAIGKNIDEIVDDGLANGKFGFVGAAKAIRAWSWQSTTDYHGEMILDQAWLDDTYVFDYDPQEDVYTEVARLCKEALSYFDRTDSINTFPTYDLVYKGDRQKWKKFIYAILARNEHHISNKPSYKPDSVISYVNKSLVSNGDNFSVPHDGTNTDNSNFFGPLRNNLVNYRQSNYTMYLMRGGATDLYPGIQDPRIAVVFTASGDSQYRGIAPSVGEPSPSSATLQVPNLWGGTTVNNVQSKPGKYIYQDKAVFPIFTYAELQFMKAEAAYIKGDLSTALAAYQNGVNAHLDFVKTYTTSTTYDTQRTTYFNSSAIAKTTGELNLSRIMTQKYISLIGLGCLETWVDLRRYHYDANVYTGFTLPAVFFADNGNKPAYRVRPRYNSEYVWNRASLDKIGGLDVDYHTDEQWFSKQ